MGMTTDEKIDALGSMLSSQITALDTKFEKKFDQLDQKIDDRVDELAGMVAQGFSDMHDEIREIRTYVALGTVSVETRQ